MGVCEVIDPAVATPRGAVQTVLSEELGLSVGAVAAPPREPHSAHRRLHQDHAAGEAAELPIPGFLDCQVRVIVAVALEELRSRYAAPDRREWKALMKTERTLTARAATVELTAWISVAFEQHDPAAP